MESSSDPQSRLFVVVHLITMGMVIRRVPLSPESDWEESEKRHPRTIKTLHPVASSSKTIRTHRRCTLSRMEDVVTTDALDLYSPGPYSKLMRPSCGGGADEEWQPSIRSFCSLSSAWKVSAIDAVAQKPSPTTARLPTSHLPKPQQSDKDRNTRCSSGRLCPDRAAGCG